MIDWPWRHIFSTLSRLFIIHASTNSFFQNGDTILIHAVKGCHIEIVRLLLNKFADVDVQGMVSIISTSNALATFVQSTIL